MEHDYFGVIDEDAAGHLLWADTVEVAEQSVEVRVQADDAASVTADVLDAAAALILGLEPFDARARDALVAQLDERASVTAGYIDRSVDVLGESLLDVLVDNSGDIAVDVLCSLQLIRVGVQLDHTDDGEAFATFSYSISPDDTDDLLLVGFDIRGDVVSVETDE